MCLIALAWRAHPRYRLVLAANRDERHARATLPLAEWTDAPGVLGGRDLVHGGGWLALRSRRMAAVTNVRQPPEGQGRSRGGLVAGFLQSDAVTTDALHALAADAPAYRPFNLLACDGETLAFATNRPAGGGGFAMRLLAPGVHGVSNGDMDAPWPKTVHAMARLSDWLHASARRAEDADADADIQPLFDALADTIPAPDAQLPDTGVGPALERFLSPAFIAHPEYGTRASTVVLIAEDHALIVERRFGPDGVPLGRTRLRR